MPVAGVANCAHGRQLTKADNPLNQNLILPILHAPCHAQPIANTGGRWRIIPFSGAPSTDSQSCGVNRPQKALACPTGAAGNNTIEYSGHRRQHRGYPCAWRRKRSGRLPGLRISLSPPRRHSTRLGLSSRPAGFRRRRQLFPLSGHRNCGRRALRPAHYAAPRPCLPAGLRLRPLL